MNYFDRVLSRTSPLPSSKEDVQLLALTAFYLAVKVKRAGPILSTHQICMISGFVFPADQVAAMEETILFTLDWCLYPPCAADFVRPFLSILNCRWSLDLDLRRNEVVDLALGMLNAAALLDYFFVAYQVPPSHLAAAALLNVMRLILPVSKSSPTVQDVTRVLAQFSGSSMNETHVHLCCERLWRTLDTGCNPYWSPAAVTACTSDYMPGYHRGCSSTPSSPVGVASATISNQNPSSMCFSMLMTGTYKYDESPTNFGFHIDMGI